MYNYFRAYILDTVTDFGPWTVTDTTTDTDHGVVNFAVTSVTLELKFSTSRSQVIVISTIFNLQFSLL